MERKKFYVSLNLYKLSDMVVSVRSEFGELKRSMSDLCDTSAYGCLYVYESLEDLKREEPGADYFVIEPV